jgi:Predicted permeases
MHLSVGTAFSITILTATASVLTHRKYNAVDFNIIKNYGTFVIIGVFSGTLMAALMNTKTLLFFFSAVVYFFGAYLLLQSEKKKKIKKKFNIFPRIIFGFLSGLISAPMGITGAMMNVPILRYFGYPINLAIGSSAAIGFIIALFGSIGFFTSGLMLKADIPLSIGFINIPAFIIFVPITTFMARIGAKTVQDLDRVKTQRLFGVFLYVIGTLFLYRFLVT